MRQRRGQATATPAAPDPTLALYRLPPAAVPAAEKKPEPKPEGASISAALLTMVPEVDLGITYASGSSFSSSERFLVSL